jgi:hypothetical protein
VGWGFLLCWGLGLFRVFGLGVGVLVVRCGGWCGVLLCDIIWGGLFGVGCGGWGEVFLFNLIG